MESTHQFIGRIKNTAFILVLAIGFCFTNESYAQQSKHALFLGNSYTYYFDLPGLTANIALSAGDTLIAFSSAPGGYTLANHLNNATSMSYIGAGQWDFVVLQEQSQMPAFPLAQVEVETFPFATQLNDSILAHSPCAETVFYMTWGREEGDQQNCANWPPVCTYEGMDDLLRERYMMMAEMNDAIVSPVGAVRRFVREQHPEIQLYNADGSHPSAEGAYLAAMCFYTTFFRKSPLNTNYSYTIAASTAEIIINAVHDMVYLQPNDWYVGVYDPQASGSVEWVAENEFLLVDSSTNASEVLYAVDGNDYNPLLSDSILLSIIAPGEHTISLIASNCGMSDTTAITFDVVSSIEALSHENQIQIAPNPTHNYARISIPEACIKPQVSIISATGKTIISADRISNHMFTIDCSTWPAGMYIVVIQDRNITLHQTMMVE